MNMNVAIDREAGRRKPILKATILYDDLDFAARTAGQLKRAMEHAGDTVRWEIKPWRLDLVQSPSLAEIAREETLEAALMVIVLSRTGTSRQALLDWLEGWAKRRHTQDAALIVVCPAETAGPRASRNRLQEFAARHGLSFLGCHKLWDEEDSNRFIQHGRHPPSPVLPEYAGSAGRPPVLRHWGINE